MFSVEGKKLLVLGDTSTADIITNAKKMGVYTVVTGIHPEAKTRKLADEAILIPSDEHDALANYIRDKGIDGVMTGASEFQILNMIQLCEKVGLPVYVNERQWAICQNKASFKNLCRAFDVPVVPEYKLSSEMAREDLAQIRYPVVVKPTDACSSKGLSICSNEDELKAAIPFAIAASDSGNFIVEKCITSDYGFGCRYIANNGEIVLSGVNDQYTVDEFDGRAHISAVSCWPSKKLASFREDVNPKVIAMFESIGLANGTFFMQALVDQDDNQIYFHEMGLRLSGGLNYHLFEAACGYNDVQMMIRYALGGPMATPEDMARIDPEMNGHFMGSVSIPMKVGVIAKIDGIEKVKACNQVVGIHQYYQVGDEIKESYIGTLLQHFCRVKIMTNTLAEYRNSVTFIQQTIRVEDAEGNDLVYRRFDLSRLK